MKNVIRTVLVSASLFAFCSCASNDDMRDDMPGQVCPMSGQSAEGGPTAMHAGQTVQFCCKDCLAEWNGLSDAEKQAKIDAMARN